MENPASSAKILISCSHYSEFPLYLPEKSKARAVWLGHMKILLWLGEDVISTETGAPLAKSTLQLFELTSHILAAQSFWGGRGGLFESRRGWDHLCVIEPWPMACQSQEWVSVFVQCKFLPALLFFWLGLVFSSFIWKNLWQEELLNCCLSWHKVNPLRLGRFCCNCSCVRQCPMVLLHRAFNHFQIFLGLFFVTSFY